MLNADPLRDPNDQPPAAWCGRCGGEVYRGEIMYRFEERWLCPDCFRAEIGAILDTDPRTLALALTLETRRFE